MYHFQLGDNHLKEKKVLLYVSMLPNVLFEGNKDMDKKTVDQMSVYVYETFTL